MSKSPKATPAAELPRQPITVKLQEPIPWGRELITELTIKRPKAKQMRAMPAELTMDALLNLAGDLSGHPKSVIDELDVEDMTAVLEAVGSFFPNGQKTGSNA